MRVIRLMNELWTRRWWCGIFRLISFEKRAFPIYSMSHNVGTQTTSAVSWFSNFSLLVFNSRWWKKRKHIERVEPNAKSRILRATLIAIKCFVFFRPFQLYKQKGVKKVHTHKWIQSPCLGRPNKITWQMWWDVNISMNVWVCGSSSTSISRFCWPHC